jgi:hypothetical protein
MAMGEASSTLSSQSPRFSETAKVRWGYAEMSPPFRELPRHQRILGRLANLEHGSFDVLLNLS